MSASTTSVLTVIGLLDSLQRDCLIGFAWFPRTPSKRAVVEVLEGDTMVAEGTANLFNPDLQKAGIGDGSYCFRIALPQHLFDDKEHCLRIRDRESGQLIGEEKVFLLPRTRAPHASSNETGRDIGAGHLDTCHGNAVLGWAWLPTRPKQRVEVEVLTEAGEVIAIGRAARYRKDLADAGIGDGFHAFVIAIPLDRLYRPLSVNVRIAGMMKPLRGGPVHLVDSPTRSDDQLLKRAKGLHLHNDNRFTTDLLLSSDFDGIGNSLSAIAPRGKVDFSALVAGDGWKEPEPGGVGRQIGDSGAAVLHLSHLPEKPTPLALFLRGSQWALRALEIWVDQQKLPYNVIALPGEREALLTTQLPAGGPVRTPVALRFVRTGKPFERNEDLVFHHLLLGA